MQRTRVRLAWLCLLAVAPMAAVVRADDGPAPAPKAEPLPDVFAEVLAESRLTVDDLGFRPRASWARYPVDPPFKMPFFDDLLAHPLDTYEFTRTLGNAVEDLLTPEKLTAPPEKDKPESLFSLAFLLGTDRRIGGARGFGFNLLDQEIDPKDPIGDALRRFDVVAGLPAHIPSPDSAQRAHATTEPAPGSARKLPDALKTPLARLLVELAESIRWIEIGLRDVSAETRRGVWASLPKLVTSTPDAAAYFPAVEDAAKRIDHVSLAYGALKALAAIQRARREFAAVPTEGRSGLGLDPWTAATPFGTVYMFGELSGTNNGWAFSEHPLLFIALGDFQHADGEVGATAEGHPLSVALMLGDAYGGSHFVSGTVARGVLGCGIVYSAGKTNTTYKADSWGLGAGLLGIGALVDEGGDDVYQVREAGEGAGYFGAGLLLDAAGNDRYELLSGDGQGYGGPGGIGILADRSGDDVYYAESLPEKAGKDRADYHSDQKIVGSNAQGVGMGRRGDVSDGHTWAGGLGALIDIDGNDKYSAGNFSQGVGYWFGTGLLYDEGATEAAWQLTKSWSFAARLEFQGEVAKSALRARGPNGRSAHELARELLAIARAGLKGWEKRSGRDESAHLSPLDDIIATGKTLAERAVEAFEASNENPRSLVKLWQIA